MDPQTTLTNRRFFSSAFNLVASSGRSVSWGSNKKFKKAQCFFIIFLRAVFPFVSSECDQHRYPWRKYCGSKVLPGVFVSRCNSTCMQIVLNSGILTNRVATGFQATVRATDEGKLMRSPRSL